MKHRLFFTLILLPVSFVHVVRVSLCVAVLRVGCLLNTAFICLLTFPVECEALFLFISAFFSIVELRKAHSFDCFLCFVRCLCGSLVTWLTCDSFGFFAALRLCGFAAFLCGFLSAVSIAVASSS